MSENFGQAGLEAEAGFEPMLDPRKKDEGETFDNAKEAAKAIIERRGNETTAPIVRGYHDEKGEPAPANETVTLERAAHDLAESRKAEAEAMRDEQAAQIRAEVDALRGDKPEGLDEFEAEPKPKAEKTDAKPAKEGDIDADLAKALDHPQVKEAIKAQFDESEKVRETYSQGVELAQLFARASFMGEFPDIAALPANQWEPALAMMAQQQPERFAKFNAALNRVNVLQQSAQYEAQQKTARENAEFQSFAAQQDAEIDKLLEGESKASQKAITAEIIAGAKEAGLGDQEFLRLFATDRTMRSAPFQKMMVDAAKYRLQQKGAKAAASKALPPVQRPGAAQPRGNSGTERLRSLSSAFEKNPSLKNAAAKIAARRAARGA